MRFTSRLRHHRSLRLMVSVAFAGALCIGSVALYVFFASPANVTAQSGMLQLHAVYFHDPTNPGLSLDAVRSHGVQAVTTAADFTSKGASADALIIDASVVSTVDRQYLRQQQERGAYIVGINMPVATLAGIVGVSASNPPKPMLRHPTNLADPAKKPIFSFVYQQTYPGGGTQWTTGQEYIYTPDFVLKYLATQVKNRGMGCPPRCGTTVHS